MYRIQKYDPRNGWALFGSQHFLSFEGAEYDLMARGLKATRYRIVMDPVEYHYENPSDGGWKRG